MEGAETACGQQAQNGGVAAPRFAVILGGPGGSACRIVAPSRLLRVWSLLQVTHEQIDQAALPPEGVLRVQRQLKAIRRELENAVSPSLAAELRRIAPLRDEALSVAALRIECAVLTSWTASLTMQMLSTFVAAHDRLSRQWASAAADQGEDVRPSGPAAPAQTPRPRPAPDRHSPPEATGEREERTHQPLDRPRLGG